MLPRPFIRAPRLFGLALLLAGSITALDQYSKALALDYFSAHPAPLPVFSFFNLVLVHNSGISFGMLRGGESPLLLALMAGGITAILLALLARSTGRLSALGLGLVIGGALGNIIDRVRFGAVVDFLDFHAYGWHWPAFNIADSGVVAGALLLFLQSLVFDTKNRQ